MMQDEQELDYLEKDFFRTQKMGIDYLYRKMSVGRRERLLPEAKYGEPQLQRAARFELFYPRPSQPELEQFEFAA